MDELMLQSPFQLHDKTLVY